MPIITAIGFDADDTLWESEIYYVNAKNEAAHWLAAYAPLEQIKADLDVIETHNVQYYGYGFKSFTLSMVETALKVSQGKVEGAVVEKILDMAKQALRAEIKLLDGVEEVLNELSPQHDLFLITKGELFEQQRKIRNSGLMRYFHHAEVVPDKNPEAYTRLLRAQNIPPEQFLMVGNSLRSDILPVVSIQGWAVLVPHPLTWTHESAPGKEIPDGRWFEVGRLRDLPAFLKGFCE